MSDLYAADFPWGLESMLMRSLTRSGNRPNFLVECFSSEVDEVTRQLLKWCGPAVRQCSMPGWLDLPPSNFEGALVLMRIEEMSIDQQIALFDWMTYADAVQVVSVATTRVDQFVRDGRFLEGLYYRLNVIRVDARSARHISLRPINTAGLLCQSYGCPES